MNVRNFIGTGGKLFSMNGKLPAPRNKKTIDWSDSKGKDSVHDMAKDENKKGGV
jgi:hypothetical protein